MLSVIFASDTRRIARAGLSVLKIDVLTLKEISISYLIIGVHTNGRKL